jgi:hypothetical protein
LKKLIFLIPMLLSFCLAGCTTPVDPVNTDKPTILNIVPTVVQTESNKVGLLYCDPNPKVTKVVEDAEDTTFGQTGKLMYRVTMSGHFIRNRKTYSSVQYSMFTDGSEVWSVGDGSTWDDENIQLISVS